jgi:hypothetical protein
MTRTAVASGGGQSSLLAPCPTHARSVRSLAGFLPWTPKSTGTAIGRLFPPRFFFLTVLDQTLHGFCANTTLYVTAASSDREEETGGAGEAARGGDLAYCSCVACLSRTCVCDRVGKWVDWISEAHCSCLGKAQRCLAQLHLHMLTAFLILPIRARDGLQLGFALHTDSK